MAKEIKKWIINVLGWFFIIIVVFLAPVLAFLGQLIEITNIIAILFLLGIGWRMINYGKKD